MKKITLLICLMLCGLFVIGGATASAAGKKPMDKEKAVNGLHDSFLFDKEELGELFDSGISYMELKKLCLHAYAAKKPVKEVAQLRDKYVWTRVDYLLGLTPEKLARAEHEYKVICTPFCVEMGEVVNDSVRLLELSSERSVTVAE